MGMPTGDSPQTAEEYYRYLQGHHETDQSRWVMADWMMDTFFVFSGLALVAFVAAWKTGAFHELDTHASIPLYVQEEDYYTPDWALDEEEWR